ncbi:hypothetical protein J6590_084261, partial [Homalodisca vitripennis]
MLGYSESIRLVYCGGSRASLNMRECCPLYALTREFGRELDPSLLPITVSTNEALIYNIVRAEYPVTLAQVVTSLFCSKIFPPPWVQYYEIAGYS